MKKLILALLTVLIMAPAAWAGGWGAGVKLGVGENDPKTMKDAFDNINANRELSRSPVYFSLEALYEWDLNDEANKIGAKIGWDMYGENELKLKAPGDSIKLTETTYSFPFTVYYKRDNGIKNFSWFAGAGFTILHSKMEASGVEDDDVSKTKVFPHIVVGGEYRFTQVFALGLDAHYNIAAKTKKDGATLSDRSGFGAALTGRFYF
ncbi:MAG: outer membrane beta-barrel protein [Elusimicrobiaceae bacterium]|nr:outer membrane beta-barrel protein [Elusimicrobiaceae bacterium]